MALGRGYREFLTHPDLLRCRLQGCAAAADPDIQERIRRGYMASFELLRELSGATDAQIARFFATGLLLNVGAVLELPESYQLAPPPW